MSIQEIKQIIDQVNPSKIDGIFQIARCVKALYDIENIKGNRKPFEEAALKHLNIKKVDTFIWLKINNNENVLKKYKSYLPVHKDLLYIIVSMTEEEISNGIELNKINTSITQKILRQYQHTLYSYKMRNKNHLRKQKEKQEEPEEQEEKIHKNVEKRIETNKEITIPFKQNNNLKIELLDSKVESLFNKITLLTKENEELKNRLDLMQKLLLKM